MTRKINSENTTYARYVTDAENSSIRFHTPLGNRQPQANTSFILIALCEGFKHFLGITGRETAAVVFNVNEDTITGCVCAQCNLRVGTCELKCILQQIPNCRSQQVPAGIDHQIGINSGDY